MLSLLISNDDGYQAQGINQLKDFLKARYKITLIAPQEERSTTGHSLSLDKPLRMEEVGERMYFCSGFPADCVLMGIGHLMKGDLPDVVISGINKGANLGQDLFYSGTIAAAREAAFHKIPSIAVSLVLKPGLKETHYQSAAAAVDYLLQAEVYKLIPPYTLLNLNVPNLPINEIKGFKFCDIGFRNYSEEIHERIDARNRNYYWIAGQLRGHFENGHTDCEAVANHFISVTHQRLVSFSEEHSSDLKMKLKEINDQYF
jgi:5'-nucleotidase